jgi:hypothetical protein
VAQDRDHWCAGEHVNETAGSIKVENFLGDWVSQDSLCYMEVVRNVVKDSVNPFETDHDSLLINPSLLTTQQKTIWQFIVYAIETASLNDPLNW